MDSLERLQIYLDQLSENKIFIGLIMVLVNIGARFIIEELGDEHKDIIQNTYFRKFIVFCSVFMATRDIGVSIIVTLIFAVIINEVLADKDKHVVKNDDKNYDKTAFRNNLDEQILLLNKLKESI